MQPLGFSRWATKALWALITCFHVIKVVFLLTFAELYWNFEDVNGALNFLTRAFLYEESAAFLHAHYVTIAAAHVVLAIPPTLSLIAILTARWRRGRRVSTQPQLMQARKSAWDVKSPVSSDKPRTTGHKVTRWLNAVVDTIGMHGPYFTPFILTVETIEIALQTWQAYRTSKYISNFRVNQLYGVMIFVNCWSTPLIHFFWEHKRQHPLMARFLSVLVDAVLDLTWGVVLQGVLYWPYWEIYQNQSRAAELQLVPENADRELRQIILVSFSNIVLGAYPFLSSAIALRRIVPFLKRAHVSDPSTEAQQFNTKQQTAIVPGSFNEKSIAKSNISKRVRHKKFMLAYSVCLMLHGLVILGISLAASRIFSPYIAEHAECVYQLNPWFATDISCVGRVVDCGVLEMGGPKAELTTVLESVSPYLLGNVAFVNCHALEMPSAISRFSELSTIAIRKSTLVMWGNDAAITATTFPVLQTLQLIDVKLNCTPQGIMNHRFPPTFEWINFDTTDVESFVHEVTDAWWPTVYFTCNRCRLLTLPRAVSTMYRLWELELVDNSLSTVPTAYIQNLSELSYVEMPENPITTLADDTWRRLVQLQWLDLRRTNISTVPIEILAQARPGLTFWAFGTPMCEGNRSDAPISPPISCLE